MCDAVDPEKFGTRGEGEEGTESRGRTNWREEEEEEGDTNIQIRR